MNKDSEQKKDDDTSKNGNKFDQVKRDMKKTVQKIKKLEMLNEFNQISINSLKQKNECLEETIKQYNQLD